MTEYSGKAAEILDAAETMARAGGYDGFSFREIASAVGVKAASVHYHFPGKADLGAALARRYTDRFMASIGDPEDGAPAAAEARMIKGFRTALREEGRMCLCGVFAAEIAKLPAPVAEEARRFFRLTTDWLMQVYAKRDGAPRLADHRAEAVRLLARLEGGMVLAAGLDNLDAFDTVMAA